MLDREELENHLGLTTSALAPSAEPSPPERQRVFIFCSGESPVVEQVEATLALEEGVVVEGVGSGALPSTMEMRLALRKCGAGVVIVTADDYRKDERGDCLLDERVTMVIGAASAFYGDRVALLWEKGLPAPSNLINLRRCEIEERGLSWEAGVQLLQAFKEWKSLDLSPGC